MAKTAGADVVVIGSGGAALRAALAADDAGASVLVLTKGELGKAGVTALSCSDRMAFHATLEHTEPGGPDAWRYHAEDIYRIGGYVSDASLARILARGACEAFHYLERLGVPFARNDDGLADQFVTDGSKYARACYTGPYTANHIHEALRNEFRRRDLAILENVMATGLALDSSGRVAAVSLADGRTLAAGAVVLATGGAGQVFEVNVFPEGMTGDGHALAYRAGAELVNLEFIQIGLSSTRTKLACSGSLMRCWPRLVTHEDREFLADYFPPGTPREHIYAVLFRKGASWPVSREEPTHVIDIAVFSEIAKGRTVWMDFSRNPAGLDLARMDPALWDAYLGLGSFYYNLGAHAGMLRRFGVIKDRRAEGIAMVRLAAERGSLTRVAARSTLAWILIDAGDFEAAIETAGALARRYPESRAFYWCLGRAYIASSRWEEAAGIYAGLLQLIRSESRNNRYNELGCLHAIARCHLELGRWHKVIETADEALTLELAPDVARRKSDDIKQLGRYRRQALSRLRERETEEPVEHR